MQKKKILIVGANGYIGSAIFDVLKKNNEDVNGIDNFFRSDNIVNVNKHIKNISYQNLTSKYLDNFTDCVWLAGHSSVGISIQDEHGALRNNLFDLISFTNLFRGRLIYASSGSVYSRENPTKADESFPTLIPNNVYDYTKIAFDNYIGATKKKAITLRFGTVNGFTDRLRNELIINSMVKSSITNGYLNVNNINKYRPILFINDLVKGIVKILDSDLDEGIYNMCSLNTTIGDVSENVAKKMNSKIKYINDAPTYNFMMDSKKFENDFDFKFTGSLEKIIDSLCLGLSSN